MAGIIVCLSAAVMGVDYGWQPVAGGGIEYIIQLEPELLDSLKSGHDVFSDLPLAAPNIRSYRITVGDGRLPHHGEPPPNNSAAAPIDDNQPADIDVSQLVAPTLRGGDRGDKPADIDVSQLPGPILGPALGSAAVVAAPDKEAAEKMEIVVEEEPQRLDAVAAEPLTTRMAGYHDRPDQRDANQEEPPSPSDQSPPDQPASAPKADAAKPTLTQLGLFTSLGCNAFLLWVATGQRSRYRALLRRMFDGVGVDAAAPPATKLEAELPHWEQLPAPDKEGQPDASGKSAE